MENLKEHAFRQAVKKMRGHIRKNVANGKIQVHTTYLNPEQDDSVLKAIIAANGKRK